MINFGKGIERSKGDYLWAGKSPMVKRLFQHRSLQHSRSVVSLSKSADRWNDTGSGTGLGAVSEVFILLSSVCHYSKQLLRPAISELMIRRGLKSKTFAFAMGTETPQ